MCEFDCDDVLIVNVLSGWMHEVYIGHTVQVKSETSDILPSELFPVSPEQVIIMMVSERYYVFVCLLRLILV